MFESDRDLWLCRSPGLSAEKLHCPLIGGTGRSGAIYSETVFAVFFDSRHGGLETTATTRFPIWYLQPRLEQFRYG